VRLLQARTVPTPSYEQLFENNRQWVATDPADDPVRVVYELGICANR